MNLWKLTTRSVSHYRRSAAAVALGVVVGSAALTGSLIVGDSIKGSMRDMALERLGGTDFALVSQAEFTETLAGRIAAREEARGVVDRCVSAIIMPGTVRSGDSKTVVPGVTVIGVADGFFEVAGGSRGPGGAPARPDGRRVLINGNLAEKLGLAEGALLLSVGKRQSAPTESIFARRSREETVRSARLEIGGVLPPSGAGAFKLSNDSSPARNVYVDLARLQKILGLAGRCNALLVATKGADPTGAGNLEGRLAKLQRALSRAATLEDYGLRLFERDGRPGELTLQGERFVLPGGVVRALASGLAERFRVSRSSVHLANALRVAGRTPPEGGVPYSVVAAVEVMGEKPFDGFTPASGSLAALREGEAVLNAWAAADLGARIGDHIELDHYASDRRGGLRTETLRLKLKAVVAMKGAALDETLVPHFEGITDAETMGEWDPPFPVDLSRIRRKDDDYWEKHSTAPKAWVSPGTVQSIWEASEGAGAGGAAWITSLHLAAREPGLSKDAAATLIAGMLDPASLGLAFRPVKAEALRAARGSTDFGILFLSMSFFLVAAAGALIGLLVRLAAERRASQTGVLLATGFRPASAARMVVREGLLTAVAGVVLGMPAGVGYAWLLMGALKTRWSGAVGAGASGLSLHVTASSLAMGGASGLLVSYVAIRWAARKLGREHILRLLGGWRAIVASPAGGRGGTLLVGVAALAAGGALFGLSTYAKLVPEVAAFFGIGALLLVGLVTLIGAALRSPGAGRSQMSLGGLALRSASLNHVRSMVTVGLLAAASFMIVAVAANRNDVSQLDHSRLDSGSGGLEITATTDVPVFADLNTSAGREHLGLGAEERAGLEGARVFHCRVNSGDEASCLNIQRPVSPRVRGVPADFIERGGFTFTAHEELPASAAGNPWRLLEAFRSDGAIPAVADAATAQWILKLGLGDEIEVPSRSGTARLRIVGLVPQSIFASELVVSEEGFVRAFGSEGGYRAFLIDCRPEATEGIARALSAGLADFGFDPVATGEALASYAEVQNTYLSTFETLGGLGLLLGTFGVVAVLLRNVVDYRGEFAMMLAMGFRRGQLVTMIALENGALLAAGVIVGTVSALVAVAPQLANRASDVGWTSLGGIIAATLVVGLVSCAVAASAAMKGDLLGELRSE